MDHIKVCIDTLKEHITGGGVFKTGITVKKDDGGILLNKDNLVDDAAALDILKDMGIMFLPITFENLRDIMTSYEHGDSRLKHKNDHPTQSIERDAISTDNQENKAADDDAAAKASFKEAQIAVAALVDDDDDFDDIQVTAPKRTPTAAGKTGSPNFLSGVSVEQRLREIHIRRKSAFLKYLSAKKQITQVLKEIKKNKGLFHVKEAEKTVTDLLKFTIKNGNAFSYLARELFDSDDYLQNHMINTCTLGISVLKRFNDASADAEVVSNFHKERGEDNLLDVFGKYNTRSLSMIALGYYLYDMGKVFIPKHILNKPDKLTPKEFAVIKSHSYDIGVKILKKNNLMHPILVNCVRNHHGPVNENDVGVYPDGLKPEAMPPYVLILKFADIYDAVTSKRSYKDAVNPVLAVSNLFRKYKSKNPMLRHIMHAFLSVVGSYPAGSIVYQKNGCMAFVLDADGPLIVPVIDENGTPLEKMPRTLLLKEGSNIPKEFTIDADKPLLSPKEVYEILPDFIRNSIYLMSKMG